MLVSGNARTGSLKTIFERTQEVRNARYRRQSIDVDYRRCCCIHDPIQRSQAKSARSVGLLDTSRVDYQPIVAGRLGERCHAGHAGFSRRERLDTNTAKINRYSVARELHVVCRKALCVNGLAEINHKVADRRVTKMNSRYRLMEATVNELEALIHSDERVPTAALPARSVIWLAKI